MRDCHFKTDVQELREVRMTSLEEKERQVGWWLPLTPSLSIWRLIIMIVNISRLSMS